MCPAAAAKTERRQYKQHEQQQEQQHEQQHEQQQKQQQKQQHEHSLTCQFVPHRKAAEDSAGSNVTPTTAPCFHVGSAALSVRCSPFTQGSTAGIT